MNLEELMLTEWYIERPEIIKQAIQVLPPTKMYKFKTSGKECHVISYEEPENGTLENVTVTVQKTGKGGFMEQLGMSILDTNKVFGVLLNDLEPIQ